MKNYLSLSLCMVGLVILTGCNKTVESTEVVKVTPITSEIVVEEEVKDVPEELLETKSEDKDQDYIGLTEKEAKKIAGSRAVPFRVVERDGEAMMVTMDFAVGRINASIKDGKVVSYKVEGGG